MTDRAWKIPTKRRVLTARDRLRGQFGQPFLRPHRAPLDELVLTVLSQSTNDRNRDIAYTRLRQRFPTWEDVLKAPVSKIERAIRPGGISKVKSKRVKKILEGVARFNAADRRSNSLTLGWLASVESKEARAFLQSLPGVGRKTAACVLLFTYGIPEMPVDTHVYRTASRLGLIPPGASFDQAHEIMQQITPAEDVFELHINMLRLGRSICRPKPSCEICPLRRSCPYGRALLSKKP